MLSVSPEFTAAINATSRRITARVTINFSDALLDPSFTATSSDENRVTQTLQAANGRDNMTFKWASCEGKTCLDGTYHPAPDTAQQANFNELGWWSSALCDTTLKTFTVDPVLEVAFSERDVTSFFIGFDIKREEWAEEFTVEFYAGASLEYTESITGNTDINRIVNFPRVEDVTKLVLTITKWSEGDRVAKVAELTPGLIQTYDESVLKNMSVLEEREISNNNSLPVGNITNNELSASFMNIDGTFDANNTASNIYGRVRPWVRCSPEIGVFTGTEYEYIPLGTFWAKAWNVPEQSDQASLSAQDRLSLLATTKITTSDVQTDQTIKDLLVTVFNDAGLDSTEYSIDSTLDEAKYNIEVSWFDNTTHRKALEEIAKASGCVIYTDRNGLIVVQAVDFLFNNNQFFVAEYDRSNYMDKQNPNNYSDLANKITVPTTQVELITSAELYKDTQDVTIGASSTVERTIEIQASKTPLDSAVAAVTPTVSGVTVTAQTWYSWGGVVTVQNTNGSPTNYKLVVTGDYYEDAGGANYVTEDTTSINSFGELNFVYNRNRFLQSLTLAQEIGDSLLESYKNPSSNVSVALDPGGDPSIELGDKIRVTDQYRTTEFNVIRQEIDFDGGLAIKVDGIISRVQRGQGDLAICNVGFVGAAITGKGE